MNKTKKVAWHKHLVKARKAYEKSHPKPSVTEAAGPARPARTTRPSRASQTSTRTATRH
jgi:hypothetical protein